MKKLAALALILVAFCSIAHAQAVVNVGPDAKVQLFDDDGNPLAGGKVCTYISGSTTQQPTYTDYTGTSQNTNPVILDIAGRANIWWITSDTYRVEVRTAGTTNTCNDGIVIYSIDGFKPGGASSNLLTSNNQWTGLNCWKNKQPWRDVTCYGATGDSVTDDGPAIQLAVNDSCQNNTNGGGQVRFPSPSVNYFVATTVDLKACAQINLIGTQGDQPGGISQFARAPRVRVQGTAVPLFSFDNSLAGCDCYVTIENLDLVSLAGKAINVIDLPFLALRNTGVSSNFDGAVSNSAALAMQGSILWFSAVDSNFTTTNDNTGPFNPAPGKIYDPASWTPAAVLVTGTSTHDGSILFDFDRVTWGFGGFKIKVADNGAGSCGQTFGELYMNMNVIEGQFASPLIQFENAQGADCAGQSATLARLTIIESQMSDVAHPTPLISLKGQANHTASISSVFMVHDLSAMSCYVMGINGQENVASIYSDSPQNIAYSCNSDALPDTQFYMMHRTNSGNDYLGPLSGPLKFMISDNDAGAVRTFIPDGVHKDDLTANSMLDTDGSLYLGPGGTGSYDLKVGRSASEEYSTSVTVPAPTMVVAAPGAGGAFAPGTYYVRVAAGDRNNTPFTVSAATVETNVVLAAGNFTIHLTWVDEPTNTSGKYTVYVGTAPGAENKAANCTCSGGVDITTMPSANQTPNSVGTLLASNFKIDKASFAYNAGTAFFGTSTHAITANRTWTDPDATGTRSLLDLYSCGTVAACSPTVRLKPHVFFGSAALNNASPSLVTITGISPAFTSNATYICTVSDQTSSAHPFTVTYVSGSSFTITTATNTITDVMSYQCSGY